MRVEKKKKRAHKRQERKMDGPLPLSLFVLNKPSLCWLVHEPHKPHSFSRGTISNPPNYSGSSVSYCILPTIVCKYAHTRSRNK